MAPRDNMSELREIRRILSLISVQLNCLVGVYLKKDIKELDKMQKMVAELIDSFKS